MKKYDVINFEDLEWYVLETNENTTKLLLKPWNMAINVNMFEFFKIISMGSTGNEI